ncbi:titin homolog isoform X2 [Physella acuta]|uniref:titin homolog isoform X2 n=1 Tax=Physella acuta TaxID=109671 RepID=UPI0027DCDC50|nr:titin homolog isoform X2 [Physella acuta]
MGSQISVDSGRQSAEDHSGSQLLYRDRQDNYPVRNDKGQSHGASTCTDWFNNVKTPSRDETAEAAGAAFEDLRWSESGASNPEDDFVTIALDPIQLYHGQAESGTMKVRFSIQSTVRRRIRAELNRGGGTIEEVHASVSEPSIDHIHIERNNFDASENVNFKQKTTRRHRKVLTNFKHSPTSSTHLQNKTGINYSGGVGEAMIASSPNLMKRLSGNSDNGAGEAGEGNKEQTSSHSQNVQQDKTGASSDNNSGSLSNYGSKQNGSQNTESPLDKNSDLLFADDYPEDDFIPSSQQQPLSTPTSFNTHVKKCKKLRKGQLKHKKTFVPLSPVLEERHHTPQHCEALGGILEETDLSFDQLFNEDVLLSDDGRSCDLNLNDFMGAAPIVKEEEFNECISSSDILFDSEKAELLNTKVFKQGNQLDSDQLQKPIVDLPPVVPAAECTNSRDLVPQNFEPSLCISSEPQTSDHLYLKDNDLLKERDGESKTSHTTLQTVKQDIMFDIEQEKSLNFQHIPLSVSENSYKNCLHDEIQNIPHLTKCPDKMNPQLELKMSAHILKPFKETLIDDIAAKSTPFLKTCKETLIDDVDPEVVTTPGSLPKRIETLIDDVPYIPHKVGLQHKHISILDEGPLQTSSPKLGRPKSRESPFKSYHQKLGKSEETLLDIMPLEHQNTKIVAKSQEELEDCKQLMKITLSRACSLGPHHRKKVDISSSLKPNIKSKETNIDDVLDQYNLLIHGELTGGNNFFIPPVIVAYPLTSATTESADLSDSERQRINFSRNPPQATRGTRPSSNPPWPFNPPPREARPRYQSEDFSNKTASGESQPKRRWTPKPKRQRQSQTQDEQDIQVPDSKVDDTRARATTDSLERSKEKNENYDQDQDNDDRLHDKAGSQRQHRRRNPDDREDYDKRGKDDKHRRRDDKYRQQEDDVNYRHREDKREKHRDDRERRREDDRDRHSEDYRDRYREDRDRHRDNKARETEQKSSNKINNEPLDFAQDKKEQRGKVIVKNRGESVFLPNFSDDASYAQDRKNETEIERDIKRSLSSDRSRRVVYHNRRTRSEEDEEDRRNADDPRRKRRSDGDKLRDSERRLREEIDTTLDETNEDLPFHRLRQDERRRKGRSAPEMNQRVSGRVNKRADRDDVKRGHRDERNPEADDSRVNDSFHSFTEKGPKYEILEQSPPSVRRAVPIDTNQHRYSQSGTSPTKDRLPEETRVEPLSPQEKLAFILKSSAPRKKRNTEDLPPVPPREPVDEYGDTLLDKSKGNKPSLDIDEKKREIITSDQQYPDKTKKLPQELTVEDAPKNLESVASLKKGKSKVYKDNLERELEDQYSVVTKPLKAYGSKEKNRIVDHPIIEPESDQIANPFKIEKKLDVTEKENFDSDKRNVEKNNNGDKKSADQPRKEKERTSHDRKKEKEISMTEPEEFCDKHSESYINCEKSKKLDYKPVEKTEFKKPERPKTSNVDDVEVRKLDDEDRKPVEQPRREKDRSSRDRKKETEISVTEPEEISDKHSESYIDREKSKKLDYKPVEKTEFKKPERPKTSNVDDVEVRKVDDEDRKTVEQPRREKDRSSRDRKKETEISMTEPEEISHRHSENYITLEKSKKLDYKPVEKTEFKKPERPKTSNVDDVEVRKVDDEDRKPFEQPRREKDRSSRERKKETEISVTEPEEISDKHSESYIDREKSKKLDYKPVEKTEFKKPERPKTSNVDDVEVRKLDEDRKPVEQPRREKDRSSRDRKKETEISVTEPEEFNNLESYISRDNSKKLENRPVEKTEFKKPERPKTSNVDDVAVRKQDDEDRKHVEQPRREKDRSSRDRKKEKEISMPEPEVLSDKKYEKPRRSYQRKPSVDYEEEGRKPDHSSFKEDKIAPRKKRNDAPADEVPLNNPKAGDLDLPVKRERKQNRKYDYEQPTEESKPGRKDDFDDKKTHIKPLPYEDTVKKADKQELEPYLYARGRRSGRIPKRTAKVEEPKKEEDSDEQQNDLGELLAENPIELTIDDNNNNDSNDEEQPTPVKKNILSIFSCVGGKSSDGLKKKSKSPLNKSKGYYEEGEKRKIKKLNKEKEKEEKTKMYFEEPEGLESVLPSSELSETPDAESAKEEIPELPFVPLTELSHEPRQSGRRYQKKVKPFEVHKPLSFVDPVLMADAFVDEDSDEDNSLPPLGTFKRWNEDNVQEPKLSSFMSAKRDENKFNSFQRFGFGRRNIMPHSEAKGDVSSTVVPAMDRDKEEAVPKDIGENDVEDSFDFSFMSSDPEADITATETEPIKLKGGSSDPSKYMKNKNKVEIVDVIPDHVFEKNENISPAEMDSFPPSIERPASKIVETDSFKVNGIDSTNEITINIEAPTPESTLTGDISYNAVNYHSHQPYTNDFDSSYEHHDADVLNTSAPAYMYADRHDSDSEKNLFAPSHVFDSSFDSPDMLYRRKHRTVSFDERITGSHSYHDAASRPPDTLSLISEPVTSRPRSSSATSNPLTYEPWRVKAYNKNRCSLSVSDMLYGKGSSRPHKCHSIGEIYNSTVASSVARRRAKTLVSGDIVSRMYQPRQRSRSRALLGDASFGSVAPIRQRSFSGFDHANSSGSGEPTGIKRSESERQPSKKPQQTLGDAKPASPSKSDTLRSTDSASGGETLEERSSKEGSPTKEHPSPTKEKKKKKKFRIPSFSKKKSKEHKESAM